MVGRPRAVGSDQSPNVEIGQIVSMREHERLALKPLPVSQHGPTGPKQFALMYEIDPRRPARRLHIGMHLFRQPVGIDQYALDPGYEQQFEPIVQQWPAMD